MNPTTLDPNQSFYDAQNARLNAGYYGAGQNLSPNQSGSQAYSSTSSPTVVSNYNTQSKVNDINQTYQNHANTTIPSFPKAVYAPDTPAQGTIGQPGYVAPQSGKLLGYSSNDQQTADLMNKNTNSFGTSFTAPEEAVLQPNGTYLYQGQYYTKDQLSSPESVAAIQNVGLQQKKEDEALKKQLDAINQQFDLYVQQQQAITGSGTAGATNEMMQNAGAGGAISQYARNTSDAKVKDIMTQGQLALSQLAVQRQQLLSAAQQAYETKNSKLLGDLNAQIEKNRTAMLETTKEANKKLAESTQQATKDASISSLYDSGITDPAQILAKLQSQGIKNVTLKDITDSIKNITPPELKGIDDLLTTMRNNGAPAETISKVLSAKNLSEAYNAAGNYASGGTGIIGEYNYYRNQAKQAGQTPVDFNTYQNMDANRKAKVAAAGTAGLTSSDKSTALKLSNDYEQRSKDFYQQRDAYNRVVSSAKDPSAAGDLALIFNYMKVLDPGSTVREGEFATAQNAGSAFNIIGAKYNKVIAGERLTAEQRKDFVNRTKTIFEGAKKQQDAVAKEFEDKAKRYGVPPELVTRGTEATGNEEFHSNLIQNETQAKQTVDNYYSTAPQEVRGTIKTLIGAKYTNAQIVEFLQTQGYLK